MTGRKCFYAIVLALCFIVSFNLNLNAEEKDDSACIASGIFDQDIIWRLFENGDLYIIGEGEIQGVEMVLYEDSLHWDGYYDQVKRIFIDNGITSIGKNNIIRFPNLTEIHIPASVRTIEAPQFGECQNLKNIIVEEGNPSFVTADGILFSADMSELVYFPSTKDVKVFTVPDTVTYIREMAFGFSNKIQKLKIGEQVYGSLEGTLSTCSALEEVVVSENNEKYCSEDGVLFSKDRSTLLAYPAQKKGRSYVIPQGVTAIGEYAFYSWDNLEELEVPESVTTIAYTAFSAAKKGSLIKGYSGSAAEYWAEFWADMNGVSFESIGGDSSFSGKYKDVVWNLSADGCLRISGNGMIPTGEAAWQKKPIIKKKVKSVVLEDQVYLDNGSFKDMSNLEEVFIGDFVSQIPDDAFNDCYNLKKVALGENVTEIGEEAFFGCSRLTDVNLPDSLEIIGKKAFYRCHGLEDISLGRNLRSLGDEAFGFSGIKKISLCENLDHIGKDVFYSCPNLVEWEIGKCRADLRGAVDYGQLANLSVDEDNQRYKMNDSGILYDIRTNTLIGYPGGRGIKDISIPDGFVRIGGKAFAGNRDLETVVIPSSVKGIEDEAFRECSALKEVDMPMELAYLGEKVFINCENLNKVAVPYNLDEIPAYTFAGCYNLEELYIPDNISRIGDGAFSQSGIRKVTNAAHVSEIGERAFYYCAYLNEYPFTDELTEIKYGAFMVCYSLDSVYLGKKLRSIDRYAFCDCGVDEIILPDSLEELGDEAFSESSLESVEIKADCLNNKTGIFEKCEHLETVIIGKAVKTIPYSTFTGCLSLNAFIVDPDNQAFLSDDGVLYRKSDNKLMCYPINKKTYDMADTITEIPDEAFSDRLEELRVGGRVDSIGSNIFDGTDTEINTAWQPEEKKLKINAFLDLFCMTVNAETKVKTVYFKGNAPDEISKDAFKGKTVIAYYPEDDASWTAAKRANYGGVVTWHPWNPETGETRDDVSPKKVTKIKLSAVSNKIAAGKKITVKATVLPEDAEVRKLKWTSSNSKVATVTQSGKVTIKKKTGGKSVVIKATATDGSGKSASWKIKVMKGVVRSVTIRGVKAVKAGKSLKLKSKVKATKGANKKLKWTSSNKKWATVNGSGKVMTKAAGKGKKVKITASATDGSGKKKTVTIRIK